MHGELKLKLISRQNGQAKQTYLWKPFAATLEILRNAQIGKRCEAWIWFPAVIFLPDMVQIRVAIEDSLGFQAAIDVWRGRGSATAIERNGDASNSRQAAWFD